MTSKVNFVLLTIFAMLFSSCATIISGTTAKIALDGNVDEPVTVSTTKGLYKDVTLPTTVEVKRRSLEGQHIQISSENYAFSDIVLSSSLNSWSLLSAVFVYPLVVDLATDAVNEPAQKRFFITPDAPRALADSLHRADILHWAEVEQERQRARLQARQLPKHYYRHEVRGAIGLGACQADYDKNIFIDNYLNHYGLTTEGQCFDLFGDAYLQAGVEYHYRLNRKWDVGVLANWGSSGESYSDFYDNQINDNIPPPTPDYYVRGFEQCRFFVVAPSVRYTWREQIGYRCYSRVALGVMRQHLTFDCKRYPWIKNGSGLYQSDPEYIDGADNIKWRMSYQLTAIGATVGNQSFHFFGELGYGSLGIVRFGVGVMF